MFGVICKNSHFSRQIVKIRIQNYSQTRFDTMNPMETSKLANKLLLKITLFKVSTFVSVCVKFQYLDIEDSVLET